MVALNGLEKFSHLEDKIYRTIELTKTLRQEKEELDKQLSAFRNLGGNEQALVARVERLSAERDLIKTKVQKVLQAIMAIDPEIAEVLR